MQVEQRHREAAADYCEANGEPEACLFIRRGNDHPLTQAFARFEASLPPSAPVDVEKAADAILANLRGRKLLKYIFDEHPELCGAYGNIEAPIDLETQREIALSLASVLAESTSNDCLLVAEAVRERCVEAAEKLVRFDRKNGDEQQRARADAFQAGQRHAAQEIRSLDLSGVGVG